MTGLSLFAWIMLYLLQLWTLSVAVALPATIGYLLSKERGTWQRLLAQLLVPEAARFQILFAVLYLLIVKASGIFTLLAGFHDGYVAVALTYPSFGTIAVIGLIVATLVTIVQLIISQQKKANSKLVLAGWWLISLGNLLIFAFFAATSSTLFTATLGQTLEFRLLDFTIRFSHLLFSAVTLVGATIAFAAHKLASSNQSAAASAARWSLKWILIGSSIQVLMGFALFTIVGLKEYPVPLGHILLTLGILSAIGVAVMSGSGLSKSDNTVKLARTTGLIVLLTFFLMVGLRIAHLSKKFEDANSSVVQLVE